MPIPDQENDHDVVKWFTRARRFPQLVGKTHDGKAIWGGPYTFTQVIVFVAILFIGSRTTSLWGNFGLIANILIVFGAAYGAVLLLGQLPIGSRNPLWVLTGALRSLSCPATGRLAGRPVRISKPHRAKGQLTIGLLPVHLKHEPVKQLNPEPVTAAPEPPAKPTRNVAPVTVVQRLLATQTSTGEG